MPRENFEPIGKQARWKTIYDLLKPLNHDDVLSYERMGEALGLDPKRERNLIHQAVVRASRELSEQHDRSIQVLRGQGYRVVRPEEHVDLSRRDQRRSSRALTKARRHVDHVDLSNMSDEGKRIVFAVGRALTWQSEMMRRFDVRQQNLEALTATIEQRGEQTAEETAQNTSALAKLEARLAELEAGKSADVPRPRDGGVETKSVA